MLVKLVYQTKEVLSHLFYSQVSTSFVSTGVQKTGQTTIQIKCIVRKHDSETGGRFVVSDVNAPHKRLVKVLWIELLSTSCGS